MRALLCICASVLLVQCTIRPEGQATDCADAAQDVSDASRGQDSNDAQIVSDIGSPDASVIGDAGNSPWDAGLEADWRNDLGLTPSCSEWGDRDTSEFERDCGHTATLYGGSYALAVQDDLRTVCVIDEFRYRVFRLGSPIVTAMSSSGRRILAILLRSKNSRLRRVMIEIDPTTCSVHVDPYSLGERVFSDLAESPSMVVVGEVVGGITTKTTLLAPGLHSTVRPRAGSIEAALGGFVRPSAGIGRLVLQSGGDGDSRVRIHFVDGIATEPLRLGRDVPQKWPSIHSNWIAWEDYGNGRILPGGVENSDVFAWDIEKGIEVAVATGPHSEERPVVLPDGICWEDLRNGYYYGPGYRFNCDLFCRRFSDWKEVPLDVSRGGQYRLVRLDWGLAWLSLPEDARSSVVRTAQEIPR